MSKKIELRSGKLEGELTTLQETLVVYTTSSMLVVYMFKDHSEGHPLKRGGT